MKLPSLPKIDFEAVTRNLKNLPLIAFALMLGAGFVMTAFAAWIVAILAYYFWPTQPEVAVEIVKALGVGLWICLGLIGLVIVALAFGKIQKISVNTPMGAGGSVEFDDDTDPPH